MGNKKGIEDIVKDLTKTFSYSIQFFVMGVMLLGILFLSLNFIERLNFNSVIIPFMGSVILLMISMYLAIIILHILKEIKKYNHS